MLSSHHVLSEFKHRNTCRLRTQHHLWKYSAWTKGLRKGSQEAKDVEEAFGPSALIRRRLVEVLKAFEEEELKTRSADYDSPSWAYKQADSVGYARALRRVVSILEEK